MTEYWVSQGKKWCDYCKIFIANNATSLRNHEIGQRHKEAMAQRLTNMRKDNIAKEKEKQQALKDLERIEQQAKRSYERDMAAAERLSGSANTSSQQIARPPEAPGGAPPAPAIPTPRSGQVNSKSEGNVNEWTYDEKSGYHFNAATGYYYDPNSGLYYSDILGKWTTQEEAHRASQKAHVEAGVTPAASTLSKQPSQSKDEPKTSSNATSTSHAKSAAVKTSTTASQGPAPKQKTLPSKGGKGVASSLEINKRRRDEKTGPVSSEEAAALAAREAAKKRVLDREKSLLGLYQAY
ncbi:hypothetical protein M758_2G060300 [Ceratodon purpureus]|nr:hypothetical protein M758_2G060300 [Ceratodon purpureus]